MPRVCDNVVIRDDAGNPIGVARVTRHARSCSACGRGVSAAQCDYPLSGKRRGATCSKHLCARCAVRVKPEHQEQIRAAGVVLSSPDSTELCPPHARHLGIGGR